MADRLRVRLSQEYERHTLLRAADETAEQATLLRAANPPPDVPTEQLLRAKKEED